MKRRSDVQIAFRVERESLRTSEAPVENSRRTKLVETRDGVKARDGRTRNVECIVRSKRQMIGRDRRLVFGPRLCLADAIDPENRAAAIADEHVAVLVESQARRYAQVARKD